MTPAWKSQANYVILNTEKIASALQSFYFLEGVQHTSIALKAFLTKELSSVPLGRPVGSLHYPPQKEFTLGCWVLLSTPLHFKCSASLQPTQNRNFHLDPILSYCLKLLFFPIQLGPFNYTWYFPVFLVSGKYMKN